MMDPLPSSPIDPGRTTAVAPSPQRTVAVAPIRTMIMTTAGLARKTADWSSDSVAASDAGGTAAARKPVSTPITRARAVVEIVPSLHLPAGSLNAATRARDSRPGIGFGPDDAVTREASLVY